MGAGPVSSAMIGTIWNLANSSSVKGNMLSYLAIDQVCGPLFKRCEGYVEREDLTQATVKKLEGLARTDYLGDLQAALEECIQEGPDCKAPRGQMEACVGRYSPIYLNLLKEFEGKIDTKCKSLSNAKDDLSFSNSSMGMNKSDGSSFSGNSFSSVDSSAGAQAGFGGEKLEAASLENTFLSTGSSTNTSTYVIAGFVLACLGLGIAGAAGLFSSSSAEKAKEKKEETAPPLMGRRIESLPLRKGPFSV